MFGVRQRNRYRDISHRAFSSISPANISPICLGRIEKHTRPIAQFPPLEESPWYVDPPCLPDQIDEELRGNGLRAWGFVIYRCTYQSQAAWDEFICRLLTNTYETLEEMEAPEILENFALTVIEDSGSLDGATTTTVRRHFQQWVENAVPDEHGTSRILKSHRNQYCLQITQDVLDSVLTPKKNGGVVRLIREVWKEYDPYDGGERLEDEFEEIEGCTLEDVGWIKVPFYDVMFLCWEELAGECWEYEYRRPPEIACCSFSFRKELACSTTEK
ncbi:uncharacterized protein N7511_004522 [Penicillium nucicola]|uniref:uncharacterized protein n=1 Tax=Penicillium nucicola TaxID=1850975 RepID=UPI0025456E72|nr:uncharacterized protein N7511_004522 [Penicillium nucicola]KAJ5766906.1 hypothetical protein N7511_004522 [Penicillium nucicola]